MTVLCCNDGLRLGPETTGKAGELGTRGFVALWRGEQPLVGDLGGDDETVGKLVRQGRLEVDALGRVVAVHGLVARSTAHRIEHEGGAVHTWCAFDAVGIPAALGIDARAVTACPTCGQELLVDLAAGAPIGDEDSRLWLPISECAHLVDDFCRHANLYCDDDHLEAAELGPAGRVLTVATAADLGRATWRDAAMALEEP